MFMNEKIKHYLEMVSSDSPTPGGGSVAALVGSLGNALAQMYAKLSLNKKKFKEANEQSKENFEKALAMLKIQAHQLNFYIDEDSKVYNKVMEAYRMPKESENYNLNLENVLYSAADVSLLLMQMCLESLKLFDSFKTLGNKNVVADLKSGAILLLAAIECSYFNVEANSSLLNNELMKNKYLEDGKSIINSAKNIVDFIKTL